MLAYNITFVSEQVLNLDKKGFFRWQNKKNIEVSYYFPNCAAVALNLVTAAVGGGRERGGRE